jgi:SAM-dependent methyltransferase
MNRPERLPALLANLRRQPDRDVSLQRYERLAVHYNSATRRIRDVRRRALDLLHAKPGETVFDVCCGAGAILVDLAACVGPQGRVIGIEQSPAMAALARQQISGIAQAEVLVAPAETFASRRRADALVFIYAHDVQQSPAALANVFSQARPGARVVAVGLCLLPWWALPVNAWVLWGARHYLTTWHGLKRPWQGLQRWCPDLRVVERFHRGTTYLATGTVAAAASEASHAARLKRL